MVLHIEIYICENIYPLGEYDDHYGFTYNMGIFPIILLRPTEIDLDPLASEFSLKAIISGHGHEGPEYCCEWVISRTLT